jgi:CMP-N,N'-diacetyllegionaminic acid synthase
MVSAARPRVLAVIPARGGSKGLPRKNIRPLAGLPLIIHSVRLAARCEGVTRCVLSTDSDEIADVGRAHGADVPFIRPAELARDDTPMMPVLRHALAAIEALEQQRYDVLLLLDPTSPFRTTSDVSAALELITSRAEIDGVVACSKPTFNPFWVGVVEGEGGLLQPAFDTAQRYTRRQDVPRFLRINGALYAWRRDFVATGPDAWTAGRHLALEIPETRAASIDTIEEFALAELFVREGIVALDR